MLQEAAVFLKEVIIVAFLIEADVMLLIMTVVYG